MRVLATLVLGLLGLWPSLATAQAVKIGAVVPLTGRYGAGGAQVSRGLRHRRRAHQRQRWREHGRQEGPLELVLLDDESDATKTVRPAGVARPAGCRRLPGRLRLRSPCRGPPRWRKRTRRRTSAWRSRSTKCTSRASDTFSHRLEVAGYQRGAAAHAELAARRRAPQDRGDLPGENRLGREMAAAWTEAGKAAGYRWSSTPSTRRAPRTSRT